MTARIGWRIKGKKWILVIWACVLLGAVPNALDAQLQMPRFRDM